MPVIRPYRSQENAYTGGYGQRASAAAFGGGIGQAVEGLGSAIASVAPILKQKANEADADAAAAAVSTFDPTTPMHEMQVKNSLNPTGSAAAYREQYPEIAKRHLEGRNLSQPAYNRAYRSIMGSMNSYYTQMVNWETQQTDINGSRLANEGVNGIQNQIFLNPDSYDTLLPKLDAQIDLQKGIDPAKREDMKIAGRQQMAFDRFRTKISDADTVEGLNAIEKELNSDPWTSRVGVKDHEQLNGVIKVQKNAIQTQAESDATAAVSALTERVTHNEVPPAEELQRAHALATKAGNKSIDNKLAVLQRKIDIINTRGKQPTSAIEQELNERKERAAQPADIEAESGAATAVVTPIQFSAQKAYSGVRSRVAATGLVTGDGSVQAAVAAGNFKQESEFRSWAENKEEGAHGIMQWRLGRFDNLKAYAAGKGKDWQDPEVQMDFFVYEGTTGKGLSPGQKAGFDQFMRATTLEDANAGMKKFIAYGDESAGTRLANARNILNGYDQEASGKVMTADPNTPRGTTEVEYAEQEALQELLKRNNDMIAAGNMMELWTLQSGQPMADLNAPGGFALRAQQTVAAANYNGVPIEDAKPFSAVEATSYIQAIRNDETGEQGVALMAAMQSMGADVAQAGAKQLGKDDPVFGYAGAVAATGDVGTANAIVHGQARMKQDKTNALGLTDEEFSTAFNAVAGKALLRLPFDQQTAIREATKALLYENYLANGQGAAGGVVPNSEIEKQFNLVLGAHDVGRVNGEQTILPRGVDETSMNTAVDMMTETDYLVRSVTGRPPQYLGGLAADPRQIANYGKFRFIEPEVYSIQMHDGTWLTDGSLDNNGQPILYEMRIDQEFAKQVLTRPRQLPPGAIPPAPIELPGDRPAGGASPGSGEAGGAGGETAETPGTEPMSSAEVEAMPPADRSVFERVRDEITSEAAALPKAAPAALRAFTSTIRGNTSTITEDFFRQDELAIIKRAAEEALTSGRTDITYSDFGASDPWSTGTRGAFQALTETGKSLAFTFGTAQVSQDKEGNIIVTDRYDFGATPEQIKKYRESPTATAGLLWKGIVENGLLGVGNVLGNLAAAEGEGREVRINLGKPRKWKR